MATTTTTTLTPAAIAQNINKALERSAEAGQSSLRRAYGEDTRQGAPKNLATAIKYARDAVRVSRDRYQEGVLTSSELLDAETRLLRAELEATQAGAQIQVALANLQRAVGGR